mgnify:CR=1 FL=1
MSRGKELLRYTAIRLALTPIMLWLIASMVFLLLRVAPGDPVDAVLGSRASNIARTALRAKLGLDQPLLTQYLVFLKKLCLGDLGQGLISEEPVSKIIAQAFQATIELSLSALIISILIGITEVGMDTNNPAIAMANTAKTNQDNNITKMRKRILTF